MMPNRRRFLLSICSSVPVLYAGAWWLFKVRKGDLSDIVVAVIERRLNYLELAPNAASAFATDIRARPKQTSDRRDKLSWIGMLAPLYPTYVSLSSRSYATENELVVQFLLSSDFFLNGADEHRPVQYLVYYDPYRQICANPFARLDDSAE